MPAERASGRLEQIRVDKIQPNPDNPRLTFRQGELEGLQESIRRYGIQVPITVYKKGSQYFLIDGERRWRCASKLNLSTIPALVQHEPKPLENLLLMFNIHALREQWDLLTIALKLPTVVDLLERELNREPNEGELAAQTGLSRSVIRRCRLLMALPAEYKGMLLEELKKPKSKQTLSEDLFIEIERALKTVKRAMPDVVPDKNAARKALLRKYQSKVIESIVDIRKIGKIARSPKVGVDPDVARAALERVFTEPLYPITEAWNQTSADAYAERDVVSRIENLLAKLNELNIEEVDDDVREKLQELVDRAREILEAEA
jgi:ParB family chromosome partitioning protein